MNESQYGTYAHTHTHTHTHTHFNSAVLIPLNICNVWFWNYT